MHVKKEDPGAAVPQRNLPQWALLDVKNTGQPLWFVKLYPWLIDELVHLGKDCKPGQRIKIGKCRLERTPAGPMMTIFLDSGVLPNIPPEIIPDEFTMKAEKATPNQYVFTHRKDAGIVRIVGNVACRTQMSSKDTKKLAECRNWKSRTESAAVKKESKVMDMLTKIPQDKPVQSDYVLSHENKRQKKDKRLKKSVESMRLEVLQLLQAQPEWNLNDMATRIDQDKNYVREFLADYATYDQVTKIWRVRDEYLE